MDTFTAIFAVFTPKARWHQKMQKGSNSPLWKRVIAWERSRAASGYGIIWGTQIETNKRNLVRNIIAWIAFNRTTDSSVRSRLLF